MIATKEVHHPNDITNIYFTQVIPEILHRYFRLPGRFLRNYTTRIVRKDGSEWEMDWLILVEVYVNGSFERILINVEFQSSRVTKEKIKIISDYKDYAKTYYGLPVLSVVIITEGFESSEKEYSIVDSEILRPVYFYITEEEIIKRLNNLEEKINNNIELSDDEGLDIVFLAMFASSKGAEEITKKLAKLFCKDKTLREPLKDYIGYGLSIMIDKNIKNTHEKKELLKMLEPKVDNSKLRMVAEYEMDFQRRLHEEELAEKDEVISEKDEVISEKDDEIKVLKQKLRENGIKY